MRFQRLKSLIAAQTSVGGFPFLRSNVLEVRNIEMLKKAMNWKKHPILGDAYLSSFDYLEDLNDRRIRDAEVIGASCCNHDPRIVLEIGTAHGHTTALMARNAPQADVYTVNIPPDQLQDSGQLNTFAPSLEEIGQYYREQQLTNVIQKLANTATWEPDFGPIDVTFIDGCHDADFVYHDTRKVLSQCRSGSIILWHDFAPELARIYGWIAEVCRGVERLYRKGLIKGRILHLQDSWVGLYKVP